ncbi:aminoglycoside phosphotransferase family protein [Streptomyces sp. NPDC050560]|uniref:aminoglycoside phosphotransferase family protein n=1 Tax=Streptomyces sp. NPDC050560 TaxID=3365630 RepID=UPI00379482C9
MGGPPAPDTAAAPAAAGWLPDERVPEHPLFPRAAVPAALAAEAAAPPAAVFRGTSHVNTAVRVPGVAAPVLVRRSVGTAARLERGLLSEHAVLAAIEASGVAVRAPRVLALGGDPGGATFAIHSYEGTDGSRHPVDGLTEAEAADLAWQLRALTEIDHRTLDPAADGVDFYRWLCAELVSLVEQLQQPVREAAAEHGLPDGPGLAARLRSHTVTRRDMALLHGDLNPWNLIRHTGREAGRLTVIDWEMAMVGDPLYELVRHLHLTPTGPAARERLVETWLRLLPGRFTRDWDRDWAVYQWIEYVRSAYVDLERLVTRTALDAPNVRRAVDDYRSTLRAALGGVCDPAAPLLP